MANRSANVIARVEPSVKAKAETILQALGVPVSTLINALYHQIIYSNGIPFSFSLPKGVQTLDSLSSEEFDAMMGLSLDQAKNKESIPLDEAIASIRKGGK